MARTTSHLRLLGVALAAVAGMLSLGGEARACGSKAAPSAARSCCIARPAPQACGCCAPAPATPAARIVRVPTATPVAPAVVDLARSASGCSCRSEAPADPAVRPDARPDLARADRDIPADPRFVAWLLADCRRPALPADPPPTGLARLRTVRLLI